MCNCLGSSQDAAVLVNDKTKEAFVVARGTNFKGELVRDVIFNDLQLASRRAATTYDKTKDIVNKLSTNGCQVRQRATRCTAA